MPQGRPLPFLRSRSLECVSRRGPVLSYHVPDLDRLLYSPSTRRPAAALEEIVGVTAPRTETSIVAVSGTREEIPHAVERAMAAAGWTEFIPAGGEVALKPNLGWDLFLPGAVTSPRVVESVARVLLGRVRKLYLVEADQVLVSCERALHQTRLDRVCARLGIEWVNLSRQPFVRVPVPDPLEIAELELPEILTRMPLITLPVMKTHNKTVLSGAIKNQWGCLPKFRHNYHPVVDRVLRDLSSVLRPAFTVLDATVALEGDGPKSGRPRICDLVLAGADPVAVDTVSQRLMGLEGARIRHLELCAEAGIGRHDWSAIEVVDEAGVRIDTLPNLHFTTARHNTVSWVESALRNTAFRRLVFESPLLEPLCWGARLWYFAWYYGLRGRSRRDRILRDWPQAGQWTERGDGP